MQDDDQFQILQNTAFSLVKSRLALGSPCCLFGCHHAENDRTHRRMAVNCPLATTSIGEVFEPIFIWSGPMNKRYIFKKNEEKTLNLVAAMADESCPPVYIRSSLPTRLSSCWTNNKGNWGEFGEVMASIDHIINSFAFITSCLVFVTPHHRGRSGSLK